MPCRPRSASAILGIPRNHPDYMALNLAIRILGGEGSNRLHQVLRTERGLTYGAQADMDTRKESGDIVAETNTRSDATGEVLRLIVDEFWRLQRERVSEGELAAAKAYMTGSFPLTIETPDSIALQVLNVMFYGLPLEQLQTFRERVNGVTVDDIERVARFYLKPDAVSVVLVGNASAFVPQLRGVGFGRFETVALENLDLLTADFKKAGGRAAGGAGGAGGAGAAGRPGGAQVRPIAFQQQDRPVVAEEGAKAKALLDRVIAAKGGLATLRGIKSIKAVTAAKMTSPGGQVQRERSRPSQPPICSIPTGCASKRRRRRDCRFRCMTANAAGSATPRRARRARGGAAGHGVEPQARYRGGAARRGSRGAARAAAARRQGQRRHAAPRAGAVESDARTAGAVRRSPDRSHRQAGLRGARARPAAGGGAVLGLSAGRRRERRVCGRSARRRQAGRRRAG